MFGAKDGSFLSSHTRRAIFLSRLQRAATVSTTVFVAFCLASCSGLVQGKAEVTPPTITVSLSLTNPSVQVSQSVNFSATVDNDPSGKGVTWSLSGTGCSGAACGTLTNVTITSVTYSAPASAPSPATVTITATCGADSSISAKAIITITSPAISVSVNPPSASVQLSQSANFSATLQNDTQSRGVTWTLSGSGCSGNTCGTLTNVTATSVSYTAPAAMTNPDTVTLTGTSVADTSKHASATVTLTSAPPPISVSVSPTSSSVQVSHSTGFIAAVQNDSANKGVAWTLSGSGCSGATCGTLLNVTTTSVTYNAPAVVPVPPSVTLTATSVSDGTKSAAATITVTAAPPPISVSVSPTSTSVQVSLSASFTAAVQNDPANKGVTWTLSGSGCSGATCGTLSNVTTTSVTYSAPAAVPAPPTVTLTATSISDGTKSAAAIISVSAAPPPISVSVSPTSTSVQVSHSAGFTAAVQNDSANKGVTWTLSGSGCSGATCGTLSNVTTTSVTYNAPAVVPTPPTVTLTATSISDGTKSAAATITVTAAPPPISVSINPTSGSVQTSQSTGFTAAVQNDPANKGVTWTLSGSGCSGSTCGTLSNVTTTSVTYNAPAAVPAPPAVTLTATSVTDGTKSAAATITVTAAPPPISVSINPTSGSVQTSQSTGFTAAVQDDPGNKGVTWTLSGSGCSGSTCGTLSNVTTTSVTYNAPAAVPAPPTVTLTATSVSDGTKSAAATITVTAAPPPISVSVSPTSTSVQVSLSAGFTATVQNDPANKGVTWTLSGSGCSGSTCGTLTVVTSSSVTYNAPASVPTPATVTLKATSVADGTKSASASITITAAPPPISVSVSPTSAAVLVSTAANFTASVQNDSANKGVTWTLSGSGCSGSTCGTLSNITTTSVTYTAPAAAPSPDSVSLTATSVSDDTKSASAAVTVSAAAPPISVSISPTSASLLVSQSTGFTAAVQNDSADNGVTWSLAGSGCSGASCGALSNVTTTSVTYTAPAAVPTPPSVSLTATSISDTTKSASATISISSASSQLKLNGVTLFILNTQSGIAQPISATKGNLLIVSYIGGPGDNLVNVFDNKGNTYVSSGQHGTSSDGGECFIFYAANATPGVTSITFDTLTNGNFDDANVYDVSGAASSPFDTATNISNQHESSFGSISGPSITASTSGGIIVANVGIESNTLTGSSSPWTFDPQDENNGWAHVLNSSSGTFTVTWSTNQSEVSGGVGYWGGVAAAFKSSAADPGVVPAISMSAPTATPVAASRTLRPHSASVAISPLRGGLTVSQSQIFAVSVANDTQHLGVRWSASGPSCTDSACGSFSNLSYNSATYTAPSSPGVYTITATSLADGAISASATVGVTDLAGVFSWRGPESDTSRQGVNAKEFALSSSTVSPATFGKLFSCPVDGFVAAQPLYVANLSIGSAKHNAVFVATENDSIYAFDADDPSCKSLWPKPSVALLPAGEDHVSASEAGDLRFGPILGITGTPVIDPATNTLYLVALSVNRSTSSYFQRLHAIDIASGADKLSPQLISVPLSVSSADGSGSALSFDSLRAIQHSGLLLSNGILYVSWTSVADASSPHDWLMAFDSASLRQISALAASPNTFNVQEPLNAMNGAALPADGAGNLFLSTATSVFGAAPVTSHFIFSLANSSFSGNIFSSLGRAPFAATSFDPRSTGFVLLSDLSSTAPAHLLFYAGTDGRIYLFDRESLQTSSAGTNSLLQSFQLSADFANGFPSSSAFFNNTLFAAGSGDPLFAVPFLPSLHRFNTVPSSQSAESFGTFGASPVISSLGTSNGIVWTVDSGSASAAEPAVLRAYDATNLATKLYDSSQQSSGDTSGMAVKFAVPVVANGKLYLGTQSQLVVFGLLPN
jgi:hypothetical protein